jgi:hypothetical protein
MFVKNVEIQLIRRNEYDSIVDIDCSVYKILIRLDFNLKWMIPLLIFDFMKWMIQLCELEEMNDSIVDIDCSVYKILIRFDFNLKWMIQLLIFDFMKWML